MNLRSKYIISFGRRRGRKISANQRVIDSLLADIAIKTDLLGNIDIKELTANAKPIHVEIGFGDGKFLVAQALANKQTWFIGCEPYMNGVASLLKQIKQQQLSNIRIWSDDARILLENIPNNIITKLYVLFPDPWPKAKHHKRRLINEEFLSLVASKLVVGGRVAIATDHEEYAKAILAHFCSHPGYIQLQEPGQDLRIAPADWVRTRYQEKAESNSIRPYFLLFEKTKNYQLD